MGHWGVKSYEVDEAHDALDAAFDRVHGDLYDELMDDRNPMTVDQIHRQLANPATLAAAMAVLVEAYGADLDAWDDEARLGLVGVVVRHAELGVAPPDELRRRAAAWLEGEAIDWDEATARRLRKEKELRTLNPAP